MPTRILSVMMCIQNLVSFCQFVLKILSKNRILTSSKGSNSVANLQKTKIYNTNIDLANDNVYTKFGLNLFILSQDIEQKSNSDINQGLHMQNLVLICLFVLKILSKNLILTSIKGRNSVANLPKFELIQALMHVLVTCKNEDDRFKNDGARVFTRFLQLKVYWDFSRRSKAANSAVLGRSNQISNSVETLWLSSLPAEMKKIRSKIEVLECSQH